MPTAILLVQSTLAAGALALGRAWAKVAGQLLSNCSLELRIGGQETEAEHRRSLESFG